MVKRVNRICIGEGVGLNENNKKDIFKGEKNKTIAIIRGWAGEKSRRVAEIWSTELGKTKARRQD